jgi:hypothetical protein
MKLIVSPLVLNEFAQISNRCEVRDSIQLLRFDIHFDAISILSLNFWDRWFQTCVPGQTQLITSDPHPTKQLLSKTSTDTGITILINQSILFEQMLSLQFVTILILIQISLRQLIDIYQNRPSPRL